jgi:4-hydroxy-2-oxoheptanedioate aldolase
LSAPVATRRTGPADLGLSLGGEPRGDQTDPKVYGAIEAILAGARKHKIRAGIHCSSTAYAKKMIGIGFQFVTVLSDNGLLNAAAKAAVSEMRQGGAGKPGGAASPH